MGHAPTDKKVVGVFVCVFIAPLSAGQCATLILSSACIAVSDVVADRIVVTRTRKSLLKIQHWQEVCNRYVGGVRDWCVFALPVQVQHESVGGNRGVLDLCLPLLVALIALLEWTKNVIYRIVAQRS
jgi:hypothetical protein